MEAARLEARDSWQRRRPRGSTPHSARSMYRPCLEPSHLFMGTYRQRYRWAPVVADAARSGRSSRGQQHRLPHAHQPDGARGVA
jgi:hypothetical protein